MSSYRALTVRWGGMLSTSTGGTAIGALVRDSPAWIPIDEAALGYSIRGRHRQP